jgi:hypothetical protein
MKTKIKRKIRSFIATAIASGTESQDKYNDLLYVFDRYVNHSQPIVESFDYRKFSDEVMGFVQSMKTNEDFSYRYAPAVPQPTIYGSVYACLLCFLLNGRHTMSDKQMKLWGDYFNGFQREDGLFVDKRIENNIFYEYDWWGARHLSLHIIICMTYLGVKPKYEFNYIKKYCDENTLRTYIDNSDFNDILHKDVDNAIMNLGCLMQYQRDFFNDAKAGEAVNILVEELEKKINPHWGSWGYGSDDDMMFLSRTQQFAYHLYPVWLYDKRPIKHIDKLIDLTLKTQTKLGGFGAWLNSSACEDIDAIFLLIKLSELTDYRKEDIRRALRKAFAWVFANQNDDGGFVFRRNEPFVYGHELTSSKKNESHLFATWFRTLSMAYLTKYLNVKNSFNVGRCPGLQF